MDRQTLSGRDFQRLKHGRRPFPTAAAGRPGESLRASLRWSVLAFRDALNRWRGRLPRLLAGGFVFTLSQWVAVFAVTAAAISTPAISLHRRYAVTLAAVLYLFLYAQLSRSRRRIPGTLVLLTVADCAVAALIFLLSSPAVPYGESLLFFTAAHLTARFRDVRVIPLGLLLLVAFAWPQGGAVVTIVLEAFGVLMLMLAILHLLEAARLAERSAGMQVTLAMLTSSLARAGDEETLLNHLANLTPPLAPGSAWAFWLAEASGGAFRAERWFGLKSGERPVPSFNAALGDDPREAIRITGPLPGTSSGELTLVQPIATQDAVLGLITVSGPRSGWPAGRADVIRSVAEVAAVMLARLRSVGEQRERARLMEIANRLAGIAAMHAADHSRALHSIGPRLRDAVPFDSLSLGWIDGEEMEPVVPAGDPIRPYTPERMGVIGTRVADAVAGGRPLDEPVNGRRPEDAWWAPAGIRQVASVPLRSAGIDGSLQVGRGQSRPFSAQELLLLEMLVDRLALVFEAGVLASPDPAPSSAVPRLRLVREPSA